MRIFPKPRSGNHTLLKNRVRENIVKDEYTAQQEPFLDLKLSVLYPNTGEFSRPSVVVCHARIHRNIEKKGCRYFDPKRKMSELTLRFLNFLALRVFVYSGEYPKRALNYILTL